MTSIKLSGKCRKCGKPFRRCKCSTNKSQINDNYTKKLSNT